jgi:hypothetical protein
MKTDASLRSWNREITDLTTLSEPNHRESGYERSEAEVVRLQCGQRHLDRILTANPCS